MRLKKFFGDKAFFKRLFAVMLPILVQNVITQFVSLIDNIMVGQLGTEQMSGVAIVNQLYFVFNFCIFGGLAGAGIFTAQFYGKKDNEGVRHTIHIKMIIAAGASLIFLLLFYFKGEAFIRLFLHEGGENLDLTATLAYAKEYLLIMLIQIIPFAVTQIYASTLRETDETILPMIAGILAVATNTGLNYILIFGKFGAPALGVKGAAIATIIARFLECGVVVLVAHAQKGKHPFLSRLFVPRKIPKALLRQVVVMGFPLLLNELLWSGGMTVMNQCYSVRGLEAVSATNISTTVFNLFFCAFFAMGSATSIIIGQILGAGELERAVEEDRKLILFSCLLSIVIGLAIACSAPLIPRIYNTTDTVKSLATRLLFVAAYLAPANAFNNVAYFTLRAGGKTMITFVFDSGFIWLFCIPTAFLLSRFTDLPLVALYACVESWNVLKVVLGYIFLKKRKWVNNLVEEN